MSVLAFLTGSRIGRYVALALLGAALLFFTWRYIRARGAEAERLKSVTRTLSVIKDKVEHDEEIGGLPADERRRRLREWARDG